MLSNEINPGNEISFAETIGDPAVLIYKLTAAVEPLARTILPLVIDDLELPWVVSKVIFAADVPVFGITEMTSSG